MAEHAWCRDIPRDEAVRAAEDGRPGPLPTLEECIEHVTERRPVPPGGGGNVTGLRTELVTLEVTHNNPWDINHWAWDYILRLGKRESVRVVEEVHFDDLANMSLERDAAIRERDAALEEAEKATALAKGLEEKRAYFRQGRDDARVECERLNARVAELESQLESVGCRAATAETALESAPSASIWRMLKVGETVEPGDEMTDDMFQPWRDAGPCVGQEVARTRLAFRRRVPSPAASVNSQAILDGSPAASNSSAILTSSPAASGAAVDPVLRQARLRDESRTEAYVASLDDASVAAGSYWMVRWPEGGDRDIDDELFADEQTARDMAELEDGAVVVELVERHSASGAAGNSPAVPVSSKPVAWGVRRSDGTWWESCRATRDGMVSVTTGGGDANNVVSPLYAAPQAAKGWLTEEEREAVTTMAAVMERDAAYFEKCQEPDHAKAGWRRAKVFRDLLARSSPPEVVRPALNQASSPQYVDIVQHRDAEWLAAIAAAGVKWKWVGK
jgi:hypothetical protein